MDFKLSGLVNYFLKKGRKVAVKQQSLIYAEKYVSALAKKGASGGMEVASVVFSKDRAMQLDAFFTSLYDNTLNSQRIYVLYKASSQRHVNSYNDLKAKYEQVCFIEETDFRKQLIDICESVNGKLFFFVDDMIFTRAFDFNSVIGINTAEYVLALGFGDDATYSLTLKQSSPPPKYYDKVAGFNCFRWNEAGVYRDWGWNGRMESAGWCFPLGVSAYLFGSNEVSAMLNTIDFCNPNTLEAGMQWFLPFFMNRYGLCPDAASCICVPANLVQTDFDNPIIGTFSVEELLELWEQGKRIDVGAFYNKPLHIAQEQKYTFR